MLLGDDRVPYLSPAPGSGVEGWPDSREILAGNVQSLAVRKDFGSHMHVEWYTDHFYRREGSVPVTVAVIRYASA